MEHYKKKRSCYYDDSPMPNELRVTGAGKAHDLTTKARLILKEHPVEGVHISAVGNHVTKAVTVVEILKRRSRGLQQNTTIKYARVEDFWEPDMEGLDSIKVTRKIPAISVHLMETADSKASRKVAESATPEAPPPAGPTSGRKRNKKRSKSGANHSKPVGESEQQAQALARPEVEGVSQSAELKCLEDQDMKRGGRGRKGRGTFPETQQHDQSRTMANTDDGKPP